MASSNHLDSETPATKKIKLEDVDTSYNSDLTSLQGFKLIKVLNENAQVKNIVLHGEMVFELYLR